MGPCEWPVVYPGCSDGFAPEPLASMPTSGVFEEMATQYLWNWTGRKYGLCPTTIRPCATDCTAGLSTFGHLPGNSFTRPVLVGGLWFNVGCQRCGDLCGCGGVAPLSLPGPIYSVESVYDDGVLLSPDSYSVSNRRYLNRTDGLGWAACGLEITYERGVPAPLGGQVAAGVLALELAKASCNDKTCQLPQRVQTVTRQGVTVAMLDAFDDIDTGHTGIWIIDSWVASITKPPARSAVLSPDLPRTRFRRTTS